EASLGSALDRDILIRGGITAAAGAAAWAGGRLTGFNPRRASTTALVGLVGAQLGQTLVTGRRSPLVIAASVGRAPALAAVIQTPIVSHFFGCTPLGPVGWGSASAQRPRPASPRRLRPVCCLATRYGTRPCSGNTAFLVAMMAWSTGSPGSCPS